MGDVQLSWWDTLKDTAPAPRKVMNGFSVQGNVQMNQTAGNPPGDKPYIPQKNLAHARQCKTRKMFQIEE